MAKDGNIRKYYVKCLVGFMKRKELNRHREKEKETEQNLEDDFLEIKVSRKLF